jgi:hypothetical protein
MTETGKAADQSLTEDAYAPGNSWGANLRERLARGDTGEPNPAYDDENPNYDAWGDSLVREYRALTTKFEDPSYKKPRTFEELWSLQRKDPSFRTQWDLYTALKHAQREPSKAKNGRPKGAWELTLTYSPKWYQDDTEAQEAFRTAERRLLKYYADELVLYRSVGEFTRDGRSHLHILYRLGNGGKFTDKNLRRAYPHYNPKVRVGKGVQGGHHAPVTNLADYSGYIEKELTSAWHSYDISNADDPTRTETA